MKKLPMQNQSQECFFAAIRRGLQRLSQQEQPNGMPGILRFHKPLVKPVLAESRGWRSARNLLAEWYRLRYADSEKKNQGTDFVIVPQRRADKVRQEIAGRVRGQRRPGPAGLFVHTGESVGFFHLRAHGVQVVGRRNHREKEQQNAAQKQQWAGAAEALPGQMTTRLLSPHPKGGQGERQPKNVKQQLHFPRE